MFWHQILIILKVQHELSTFYSMILDVDGCKRPDQIFSYVSRFGTKW